MNPSTKRTPNGHPTHRPALRPALGLALVATLALAGCQRGATGVAEAETVAPATEQAHEQHVARGEYLVTALACGDCHTPWVMGENGPQPDATRLLAGHPEGMVMPPPPDLGDGPWIWAGAASNTAFAGPWGVTYAFNLTPDENTGLGIWTEEMFVAALRDGKHMGQSRPIMPPMPWPAYSRLSDEDLSAIYAYLRSIPPIHNRVPEYAPPAGAGAAQPAAAS